ncbi:MAG: hypothetical protein ABI536_05835 [Gallionella sp.]
MDNKIIFVRTRKGEEAVESRTSPLPGDVKRALLMVDGSATFGEISKRAAPSMRAGLAETFQELEKSGLIQPAGKSPAIAVPRGMIVPKMATPQKKPAVDENVGELDFMSGFTASPPQAPTAEAIHAEKLKAEAEEKSRLENEAEKINAQREAAAILLKAEQKAARIREEEARRAKEEIARLKSEQEARKVREELEAARLKTEQETRLRLEAEARERLAEAARAKSEQAAALLAKHEAEAARRREAAETPATTDVAPVAKPDAFAFDTFHIDEPQRAAEPPKDQQAAQKASTAPSGDTTKIPPSTETRSPAAQQISREPDKLSEEQIKQEAQQRIEAEQRIAAEAQQAKELASAQTRVWAEAEQRAVEAARVHAEQIAQQAKHAANSSHEKPAPIVRAPRKPFAWGGLVGFMFKLGIFLLVLLVGALFLIPYVLPMRDYMPKVQQLLSDRLHQPVHLGYLSGRILPTPRLDLGEIYIGDVKQFQAKEAQINFAILGLFGDKKPISSIEFQEVKISGAGLLNAAAWLQQLANNDQYPVSRMVISQGMLDADAFQLSDVAGELDFSPAGKFIQADLRANAGKFTLAINATPEDKLQVALAVRNSALPLLPNWSFDQLTAKGELNKAELQISDFDGKILGGTVQGNANINWRSGWRAQGALSAKTITMQSLSKLLDGNADGSARFRMASTDLAGLTDSATLDGSFTVMNGMISGMDIVETARMRSRENLPGGRTHYDGITGVISYANNIYHFKQVKVTAGVLNAIATFDVTKKQLSGKMNVSLTMRDSTAPVELQMGGAIDNPTLRYAP